MQIKQGYVYHIKNEYFEVVNDDKLMKNHEGNYTRPNYFCFKNENEKFMWFIPMSSQVEKYRIIIKDKIKKYGRCDTIIIGKYRKRQTAFLLQNMFPITEKYIDHIDVVNNKPVPVVVGTQKEIENKVKVLFKLKKRGINLIFPDVDRIKELLLKELETNL